MSELLWAWAAGIIDGEGSFSLSKIRQTSYSITLSVEMSCQETILKMREIFKSGGLYERKRKEKWSKLYKLQVYGLEAINIAKRLLPYLVTKKKLALLIIEYGEKCRSDHGQIISDEISMLRQIIYEEMRDLNKKGT